jgi:hypothetical protein
VRTRLDAALVTEALELIQPGDGLAAVLLRPDVYEKESRWYDARTAIEQCLALGALFESMN